MRKAVFPLRDKVAEFLAALGVTGAADDPLLDLVINQVQLRIENLTNLQELPEGLIGLAVQMAVGEYLRMEKSTGQLTGFDLDAAVKQIREGDTTVSFAIGEGSATPEQRLDALISTLTKAPMEEISRYRRLVW